MFGWSSRAAVRASRLNRSSIPSWNARCGQHRLDGDLAIEPQVVGEIHDGHAAASDLAADLVFAGGERPQLGEKLYGVTARKRHGNGATARPAKPVLGEDRRATSWTGDSRSHDTRETRWDFSLARGQLSESAPISVVATGSESTRLAARVDRHLRRRVSLRLSGLPSPLLRPQRDRRIHRRRPTRRNVARCARDDHQQRRRAENARHIPRHDPIHEIAHHP